MGEEQAQPAVAAFHAQPGPGTQDSPPTGEFKADRVVVEKAKRTLCLYRGHEILGRYPVALGQQPLGPKRCAGDQRTPEGRYTLDWRNADSKYFRSIHISYPNRRDRQQAQGLGQDPGGEIMIHGTPGDPAERAHLLRKGADWTAGCIAVQDEHMQEIWDAVEDGTPIEILP